MRHKNDYCTTSYPENYRCSFFWDIDSWIICMKWCASFAHKKIMWAIWTVWRSFHVLFEEVIKQKRTKYLVKEKNISSVRSVLRNILSIWAICLFRLLPCPFIASLAMLLQASRGEKAIQTEKHLLTFKS